MDLSAFLKVVERGELPPVVLLHGGEPLLLDDAVAAVTRALFPGGGDLSLAREVLDAREAGADGIVTAALTLPWSGARRLVVVKGVEAIAAKPGTSLAGYIRSPNPSTALLLLAGEPLAGGHWLIGAVPSSAVVPAAPPPGGQLVSWLRQRAASLGYEIEPQAAALLVEMSGDDLGRLHGEVEKAAMAGGPDNRRVGVAEVRAVVGEHRVRHVFDLTRALLARDAGAALGLLESLLNTGEEPLAVLGMLAREARAVEQAAAALREGRRPEDVARGLRRPPASANQVIERAQQLGAAGSARWLEHCWDAERRIKLGGAPRAEMSLLVALMCT